MNAPTLHRAAPRALTATMALVLALLSPPSASAAEVTEVLPGAVVNTASTELAFAHPSELLSGDVVVRRTGTATDTLTSEGAPGSRFRRSGAGQSRTLAPLDLHDGGDTRSSDGPANPGTYDVVLDGPAGRDTCTACFTVLPPATLALDAVSVRRAEQGSSTALTLAGEAFARGTVVEVLDAQGAVDPRVQVQHTASGSGVSGADGLTTSSTMLRQLEVDVAAARGPRSLRVRNTDGASASCPLGCVVVDGPAPSRVSPSGATNGAGTAPVSLTVRGTALRDGTPVLRHVPGPDAASRDDLTVVGQDPVFATDGSAVTALYDLRHAAPGLRAYQPALLHPDGSEQACTCRFDVLQPDAPVATAVSPASGPAGATRTVTVDGRALSRGAVLRVSGGGVTASDVHTEGGARMVAALTVAVDAPPGPRDVTVQLRDGTAGPACRACFTVTTPEPDAGSARPTSSAEPTSTPRGAATTAPAVRVDPAQTTAGRAARVSGTAQPGSTLELHAYTRPSTTYRRVRRVAVGPEGTFAFDVRPDGDTRLFVRSLTSGARTDSASVVLRVRTAVALSARRTSTDTLVFSGRTRPAQAARLISVSYRDGAGRRVEVGRARTTADGAWSLRRRFTGRGSFVFTAGTGATADNAAGESRGVRSTVG